MDSIESNSKILLVASSDNFRQGIRAILEEKGYEVFSRQSIERCIQLLELSDIALVICDYQLEDGTSLDLLQKLQVSKAFYSDTPIYCIGKNKSTSECILALENGAEEFSSKPLNKKIFLSRLGKIIRRIHKQKTSKTTLESHIETSELPGVLQYLEAEVKTGILQTTHKKEYGEIYFKAGKVVHAETEYCAAQDAITEILSWPFVHLRFVEDPVGNDFELSLNISSTLMDCVFEVDEFKEVMTRLPNMELSFIAG
ncbi:MAG: response regulator, partial [Lentisphaeraceae bacterium]|nr:response regulator [Lentisphaeraceae bacterium]